MRETRQSRRGLRTAILFSVAVAAVGATLHRSALGGETWRGLVVAPEHRCAPYRRGDYPYSPSVEARIVAGMGDRVYGPYTGRTFAGRHQTDIEHIVAVSEAHDSGLCAAAVSTRRRFASDPLNLTLAAPEVNRCGRSGKCGKDAAEWLPPRNRCWFAARAVEVRRKYRLTIDRREARVLDDILKACGSTEMVFHDGGAAPASVGAPTPRNDRLSDPDGALARWDDNRNGRIACREARRHGIAPVRRGHPAYPFMRDGDGDGIVCE